MRANEKLSNPPLAATDFHALPRRELAPMWLATFGRPLPATMRQPLAAQVLLFHQQELAFGGLPAHVEAYLASLLPSRRGRTSSPDAPRRLRPGTRLLRTWRGETYVVNVTEGGFLYEGQTYRSLSVIAREITGTAWSGPAFFELKSKVSSP
ncbi:MAG TPA: DUF2924 domain-containing protein [Rhodanobacteraceae bacterium]|nr:DUF2924 domain-containing protein [Rhodanobacteraceae bacterium]